jgi:hypothetical protein
MATDRLEFANVARPGRVLQTVTHGLRQ